MGIGMETSVRGSSMTLDFVGPALRLSITSIFPLTIFMAAAYRTRCRLRVMVKVNDHACAERCFI
jgi:hypothetical protein